MKLFDNISRLILSTIFVAIVLAGTGSAQSVPANSDKPAASDTASTTTKKDEVSSDATKSKIFEDWTTPSLEGTTLKLFDVIPGDVDTIDGVYTHEVTRVQWRPADPIDLYIIKPAGVKNPPVILYLYSYPFETDKFLNHDFCKFLTSNGFAAVGFASALTSHRYHDRPMKQWFVSELRESLATSAHDVQFILNYLDSRGDFDMSRVGMFGDGSGATIAILAAAVDPRIKSLDLLNPWGDWPDWVAESTRIPAKERPDYLKPDWQAAVAPLDPVKWLPQLKTQKIRLQFVQSVTITPADVQKKIEAAAPANAEVALYENAEDFRASVAGGKGLDWIKEQVQGSMLLRPYRASGDAKSQSPSPNAKDWAQ